jgi:hypothetical protein
MDLQKTKGGANMTAKDLAKEVGCTQSWVYYVAKQLGRLPTKEELLERKGKRGRPQKWEKE